MDFIRIYFTQEKIESIFFLILGLVSIAIALIFWFMIKYSLFNGIAYPFLLIGIIQIVVGTTIILRTTKDIQRVENIVKYDSDKIKSEELPRMEKIMKNFKVYKIIELVLILFGAILFIYFFSSNLPFWKGLGLGLLIQACIMLALDFIAEDKAAKYIDELGKFIS